MDHKRQIERLSAQGRGTRAPHRVDVHVGKRIRAHRRFLGMSLQTLAEALGLTYQQVQKYERGANRISASQLSAIADVLGVPIGSFFTALEDGQRSEPTVSADKLDRAEAIKLVRLYYAISDAQVRARFFDLVKVVAAREANKS